jgi:hypothetical protein
MYEDHFLSWIPGALGSVFDAEKESFEVYLTAGDCTEGIIL